MNNLFKDYFDAIKGLDVQEATEHTLRTALENLLCAVSKEGQANVRVIHEPKQDKDGKGAPDFKFKVNGSILGYLENKKTDANLNHVLKSEQIAKYRKLSNNLVLTNYLEWIWLRNGAIIKRETLCYGSDVGNRKARLDVDKAEKVETLIKGFLSVPPEGIGRVKDLAIALATRCHDLREFLTEELIRQQKEHEEGKLFGLYNIFKKDVFHELDIAGFADAFAQMLGYGLFLARLNSRKSDPITLENAKRHIPANFELIGELVSFLDELDKDEYQQIRWLIEEILSIMNSLDLAEIHEDLAFSKRQGRLFEANEEERLLFAKDPYVYFYEDFLKAYDAEMRKARGVYYTPRPVVNFIIRAVNDILRGVFSIKDGLADRKRVTVLDFATGTGTFLLEVLVQILDTVSEGIRDQIIREHALRNLYGFEYLIAPYTIAHLKLSQFLQDRGYILKSKERLQIYLTNTLEPIEAQRNLLLPVLSKEVEEAQAVKKKAILVITGNPPYAGHSKNKGAWITAAIDEYKKGFPELAKPGQGKWLQDDYVKFIRFAQMKMDAVEGGVVGIITNHSYLDNPTFRGMRLSLMRTFDQIWVLDLHGNTKKKEQAPDGGIDQNVFDIEQGVAIAIFVKKRGAEKGVWHADLWGKRLDKYRACAELGFREPEWEKLAPVEPNYLYVPRDNEAAKAYEAFWSVPEIFAPMGDPAPGIVTTHDEFAISFTKEEAVAKVDRLLATKDEKEARRLFRLCSQSQWSYDRAKEQLGNIDYRSLVVPILYRPFDQRWTIWNSNVAVHRRERVMRNMLRENVALLTARSNKSPNPDHFFCSEFVSETKCAESTVQSYCFPLYYYRPEEGKAPRTRLFDHDPFDGRERIENFSPAFRAFIDQRYGKHYSSEEILGYIYAVLYAPTYRREYASFLKVDFPRIPFTRSRVPFEKLSDLGGELVQGHLMKLIPAEPRVEINKGSHVVEKVGYDSANQRLSINRSEYFAPVPEDVWQFHIGGYQVLEKYLKSRKGRTLSLDEIENVQNVVKVLRFTIDQIEKIEAVWKP